MIRRNPSAEICVGADYSDEEREFLLAMDRYKRLRGRPFPQWSEVLAVAVSLGYRKVARATALPKFKGEMETK